MQITQILSEKQSIDEEITKAEDRLKTLSKTKNPQIKVSGSSKSIQALEQQNDKLVEEYNTMQKENKDIETTIFNLKQ